MAKFAIAGFFILVAACCVGFGVASADSSDDLARAGAFGFDEATQDTTRATAARDALRQEEGGTAEGYALTSVSERDLSSGFAMIGQHEADEEADDKAIFTRVEATKAKQGVVSDWPAGCAPSADATEYGLPAVDWSCGKKAFLAEWAPRIDAYLAGSTLAGYGAVFAEAAWVNGVDPRWSPAIANTESGKGKKCFRLHNAWGWGDSGWPDWKTAIREHVAGLARVYGYSITPEAAAVYCPPNHAAWYADTLEQMASI